MKLILIYKMSKNIYITINMCTYIVLVIPTMLNILIKRKNIAAKNGCSFISRDGTSAAVLEAPGRRSYWST